MSDILDAFETRRLQEKLKASEVQMNNESFGVYFLF